MQNLIRGHIMSYLIWLCTVCQCPIKWWINPCPAETGYVIFRKESKSRISWLNLVNTSVDMRSRSDCFPDSIRFHWKTEVNVPYSYLCSITRVKALISKGQQKLVKLSACKHSWPDLMVCCQLKMHMLSLVFRRASCLDTQMTDTPFTSCRHIWRQF